MFATHDQRDQCNQISSQRTQRNIMCQGKDHKEYNRTQNKQSPVKSKQKSHGGSNSLAAAESQIYREIVSEDTSCCRIDCKQRQNV